MMGQEQDFLSSAALTETALLKASSSVICLINIGFCLGATPRLVSGHRGMFCPNASFGVQTTSMKKLSVFGAFRFSEFRIRDCVPVAVVVAVTMLLLKL
jgi:hypothetical protein